MAATIEGRNPSGSFWGEMCILHLVLRTADFPRTVINPFTAEIDNSAKLNLGDIAINAFQLKPVH